VLALAAIALGGCSEFKTGFDAGASAARATADPSAIPSAPTARPTSRTPEPTFRGKVGSGVGYTSGWTVTLVKWEEQAPARFSTPRPGLRYIAVFVRLENASPTTQHVNPLDFKIQDATGVRREHAFFSDRSDGLGLSDVVPGAFVAGSLVFEAPIGDAKLELIYDGGAQFKQATWELY
jgi:hypothetical protein